ECVRVCFFFQAEDGIRDFHVTGVQTCALPISQPAAPAAHATISAARTRPVDRCVPARILRGRPCEHVCGSNPLPYPNEKRVHVQCTQSTRHGHRAAAPSAARRCRSTILGARGYAPRAPSSMDGTLKIPSVTGIDVELRIAGPGGRSYAFVIDWHIRVLVAL